jgi:hypothetical protein
VRAGEAFDTTTGLPMLAAPVSFGLSWMDHAQSLVDAKWNDASPRHRQSTAEALATITMALTHDGTYPEQ